MSIISTLYIDDDYKSNILRYHWSFIQNSDRSGRPSSRPTGGNIQIVLEATKSSLLAEWVLDAKMMKYVKIVQSSAHMNGKSRVYEFYDAMCLQAKDDFDGVNNQPMRTTIIISSPLIVVNGVKVKDEYWKVTDLDANNNETVISQEPTPNILKTEWIHPETKKILEETAYTENVAFTTKIQNPSGNAINITITKKDGTEFEQGKKELSFSEILEKNGTFELTTLEIKEQWQDFKETEIDELIAKVTHSGVTKKSKSLQIIPSPKVIVDFRPSKNYDGEYGFDYMRHKKDKDDTLTYKDILGTNYEYDKKKKEWIEKFKKHTTDTKYNDLKDVHYKTITFPWYKDNTGKEIEYIQTWLTIYPKQTQTLSLQIETIENPKKLDLTFEYDKTLFKLNTEKIPAQSKGKKRLKDHLTVECLKEFSTDQTIKVLYKKQQLGQLNILANAKSKRKKLEVVFVEVETKLFKVKKGSSTGKKAFLTKYLQQAFIKPNIATEQLDLKTDKTFNKKFDPKGKGYISNRKGLHDYLNSKLDKKYKNYLKVYFIGDECPVLNKAGKKTNRRVNGQAKGINSDAVVLFQGHNTSTTAHEALHALGLHHTFSPNRKHPYSYKIGETYNIMDYSHQSTYGSKKRIITWLWQWKKLWNNPLVKPE